MREFHEVDDARKADGLTVAELAEPGRLERYVKDVGAGRRPNPATAPVPEEAVPFTLLWWADPGDQTRKPLYVGSVCVNHELNPALRRWGGHIAYNVRPSQRRRGHATRMLAAVLPVAHTLGVAEALLTTKTSNIPSRKVIETNHGRLEETTENVCRYWITTKPEQL